jgi:hypothetical protein
MGSRPAGYWICVLLAVVALFVSFMMRSSADAHTREISKYIGYSAIALVILGRVLFGRKPDTTPPMPKD